MMDSGEMRRQRERDTGPLLEETHDKQVNESGRLESVCLWRNYTSKKIPPKRRRPRTKGRVTRRTCRRDWWLRKQGPWLQGRKCRGACVQGTDLSNWPVPREPERQALLAVTGGVDATLSHHESLTGHTLTYTLKETTLALPRGYTGPERGSVGLWMVPVSFAKWHLTTALIQAADDRWLNEGARGSQTRHAFRKRNQWGLAMNQIWRMT